MSNPVVLITGALTGIGRATAFAFANEGARMVVSGRSNDAGEALVTELRSLGGQECWIDSPAMPTGRPGSSQACR